MRKKAEEVSSYGSGPCALLPSQILSKNFTTKTNKTDRIPNTIPSLTYAMILLYTIRPMTNAMRVTIRTIKLIVTASRINAHSFA